MATATNNAISIYSRIDSLTPVDAIPFDIFIENVRIGFWQDFVLPLRAMPAAKHEEAKKRVPYVTISGTFSKRRDDSLAKHSTLLGTDLDDLDDPEAVKEKLRYDPYVVAAFRSIGGRGLCVVFKINPDKHREAFDGIGEYLLTKYNLIHDPTSINISRARFVSFDPALYFNEHAQRFTLYQKAKPPKKIEKVIFAKDDFERILQAITERRINLAENYYEWLRIGFAFADRFAAAGRDYYHMVSQFSTKYDVKVCNRQYDAILKHTGGGKKPATIATFYYYAKQAGIELYSERTRTIAYTAAQGKKAGLNEKQVAQNLEKFEGITAADDIIAQVMQGNIQLDEDTLLDQLELYLRQNYTLQRNEITRYIENNGEPLKQKDLNSIYIKSKKIFETLSYDLVDRLVNSDFVPTYNPLTQYFTGLKGDPTGLIEKLFNTVQTRDQAYAVYFGRKWMVGVISSVHGTHSPLMLVLSGDVQNTGKTEWFRRLLPPELKPYYAESKLDAGKDDEILMTQKLLIMDDEMGGKSKKEVKRLKELTSKQTFSLREPYGRNNVDLNRIAVLCGTTNENEILSDPTGNRRIIPIHVQGVDTATYNTIDKTELWMEAYNLYRSGFAWQLNRNDITYLATYGHEFEMAVAEAELLQQYFEPGEEQWTVSAIKVYIEGITHQRLSISRLGMDLKRLGYAQLHVKRGLTTARVYLVKPKDTSSAKVVHTVPENLPF